MLVVQMLVDIQVTPILVFVFVQYEKPKFCVVKFLYELT